jgi:lysophospholipase L1-like esterase
MVDQPSNLAAALAASLNPQLIIMALGQNDVTGGVAAAAFRAAAQQVLNYAVNTMHVPIVVVAIPLQPTWTGTTEAKALEFNTILREEAVARGMPYVAGWARCLTSAGISQAGDVPAQATASDGYHPNNTGHQQLHDALWAEMKGILYVDL